MAEDLLEGATRVLAERGAEGFTTNHVAEATGVSIGSLYQYFPNKASLLIALHEREAEALWSELESVLADRTRSPRERLMSIIPAVFAAQRRDFELQVALHHEGAAVPEGPRFKDLEERTVHGLTLFLADAHPGRDGHRAWAVHAFFVLTSLLDRIGREPLDEPALEETASRTALMLAAYFEL